MNFQPSQLGYRGGSDDPGCLSGGLEEDDARPRILACGAIVGAPWIMILIQPDLGSCIVWVPVVLAMMFIGGIPKRWLIAMLIVAVALLPLVVYFGLKEYQYRRITTFLAPEVDPQGGWLEYQPVSHCHRLRRHERQGFKAPNTQNELGFLPATIVHNDFIFSVMGEQHGFIGGVILIGGLRALLCHHALRGARGG